MNLPHLFSSVRASMCTDDEKVDELWRQLEAERPHQQTTYFNNKQVKSNRSSIACPEHAVITVKAGIPTTPAVPVHANEIRHIHPSTETNAEPSIYRYIAAQSPEEDCTRLLIQGLDSQQGIYQFVSPKTHRYGRDSGGPTIATMLYERWAAKEGETLMLGDRYEVTDLRRIGGMDDHADHVRHEVVAIDRHSPIGEARTMLLTQAGLQFSGRVLQPAEISRADALLSSHRSWCTEKNRAGDDIESSSNPMIASYAGIGRNAVLISYRDMCLRIESGSVNKENLDATLKSVIQAGRLARGPRFLHSRDQLAALRKILLEKLGAPSVSIPVGQRARQWVRRAFQSGISAASGTVDDGNETRSAPVTPTREPLWPRAALARLHHPFPKKFQLDHDLISINDHKQPQRALSEMAKSEPNRYCAEPGSDNNEVGNVDDAHASALHGVRETPHRLEGAGASSASDDVTDDEVSNSDVADTGGNTRAQYQLRDVCRTFDNTKIDMAQIDLQMSHHDKVGPHRVKKLASSDNGSWWRAAYLSVFVDAYSAHDVPHRIHDKVLELGPDFTREAQLLKEMAEQAVTSERGLAEIMTNMPDVHHRSIPGMLDYRMGEAVFEASMSQFKTVGEDDADPRRPGEQALKKVARALLLKGGIDRLKVEQLFDHEPPHAGEVEHVIELMNQLGTKRGSIFTRIWKSDDTAPPFGKTLNLKDATLSLFVPANPADLAAIDKLSRQELTDNVQQGLTSRPVIVLDKNGPETVGDMATASRSPDYFSVSVPKSVLLGGKLRSAKRPGL